MPAISSGRIVPTESLDALVGALAHAAHDPDDGPRRRAGHRTDRRADAVISPPGDILIDGGNSDWS
jgi:hypothetical protein